MTSRQRWGIRGLYLVFLIYLYLFVHGNFYFLQLNTLLGYIPIEIAFHVKTNRPRNGVLFWLLIACWLVFYPNAPYLLTDFFHLSLLNPYDDATGLLRNNTFMWQNFTYLLISGLSCTILGYWSLDQVVSSITHRYNLTKIWRWYLVIFTLILSSLGIYIGRFLRLHSIYLIIMPKWSFQQLITMWNLQLFQFVFWLSLLQFITYLCLHVFQKATHDLY